MTSTHPWIKSEVDKQGLKREVGSNYEDSAGMHIKDNVGKKKKNLFSLSPENS